MSTCREYPTDDSKTMVFTPRGRWLGTFCRDGSAKRRWYMSWPMGRRVNASRAVVDDFGNLQPVSFGAIRTAVALAGWRGYD